MRIAASPSSGIAGFYYSGGNLYVNALFAGSINAGQITSGTITASSITIAPSSSSYGLTVLNSAGQTILDSVHGIYPGSVSTTPYYSVTTDQNIAHAATTVIATFPAMTVAGKSTSVEFYVNTQIDVISGSTQGYAILLQYTIGGTTTTLWTFAGLTGTDMSIHYPLDPSVFTAGTAVTFSLAFNNRSGANTQTVHRVVTKVTDLKA